MLDNRNVIEDKALPGVIIIQAAGVCKIIAAASEASLVEISSVLRRLFSMCPELWPRTTSRCCLIRTTEAFSFR